MAPFSKNGNIPYTNALRLFFLPTPVYFGHLLISTECQRKVREEGEHNSTGCLVHAGPSVASVWGIYLKKGFVASSVLQGCFPAMSYQALILSVLILC